MKEVLAIIRPQKWTETKRRLHALGLPACVQQRVLGRGRERGLQYLPRRGAEAGIGVRYLPKRMVSWVVEAHQVEPMVHAIMQVNRTGQLGDGVIFILPIDEVVRVRTGERGVEALRGVATSAPSVGMWSESLEAGAIEHASGQ